MLTQVFSPSKSSKVDNDQHSHSRVPSTVQCPKIKRRERKEGREGGRRGGGREAVGEHGRRGGDRERKGREKTEEGQGGRKGRKRER